MRSCLGINFISRILLEIRSKNEEEKKNKQRRTNRRAEPSRAGGSSARPRPSSARGRAHAWPGRAPPARPESGCSVDDLARSNNNDRSSFLVQFESIVAPFPSSWKPFQ